MTTDLYQFTEEPVIAILGIGEDSKKYIDEIKGWHSPLPLVSAKILDRDFTGPGDGIEIAILIITENVNATVIAKKLKQSMFLTLIVTTCEIRAKEGSYDSMAVVSADKVMETVRTVAGILSDPSFCICKDSDDLWSAMKNSGTFQTFLYTSSFEGGSLEDHMNYLNEKLKRLGSLERILVKITLSTEVKNRWKTEDLMHYLKFFDSFPYPIQVLGGLSFHYPQELPGDELAIMAIATEPRKPKELPIKFRIFAKFKQLASWSLKIYDTIYCRHRSL